MSIKEQSQRLEMQIGYPVRVRGLDMSSNKADTTATLIKVDNAEAIVRTYTGNRRVHIWQINV